MCVLIDFSRLLFPSHRKKKEPVATETLEVVESIPKERLLERTSECTVEHFVGVPVPQIQERTLEVAEIMEKRIPERTVGQIDDLPVPQILNEVVEVVKAVKTVPQERISEGVGEQIVDAPASHTQPQISKEVVEVVKAVKTVPQERISEGIGEQIDDDIVPVDQPGDQACCDTQACGDAEKGPSDSDCFEDGGNPSGEVRRQSCGLAGTVSGDDSSEESDL